MSATTLHRLAELGDRHPPHDLEYADATALNAADKSFISTDLGREAKVGTGSGSTYWRLVAITGSAPTVTPTWVQVGGTPAAAAGLNLSSAADESGASPTISDTEHAVYLGYAGTKTVTLPAASSNSGKVLFLQNTSAYAAVSASSNIVPLGGGSAGTALLPAVDGAWAVLHSDGTNWRILLSGVRVNLATTAVTYQPSGTTTIDLSAGGEHFTATAATGGTTWAFSSPLASGLVSGFVLDLTNGGSQTQNFVTAGVDWPGGTGPALTASGKDRLIFETHDGGTIWYGAALLDIK